MELSLKQKQQLSQQQLQSIEILQLSTLELEQYLQNLAEENPVVDLEPPAAAEPAPQADHTFRRLEWLEDNDYQNRYYQHVSRIIWTPSIRWAVPAAWKRPFLPFCGGSCSACIWTAPPKSWWTT